MGEDVVLIDFDKSSCSCDRFVNATTVEKRHPQSMKSILIIRIDIQSFFVRVDGFIELVIPKRVDCLLEVFFLRHVINFI